VTQAPADGAVPGSGVERVLREALLRKESQEAIQAPLGDSRGALQPGVDLNDELTSTEWKTALDRGRHQTYSYRLIGWDLASARR